LDIKKTEPKEKLAVKATAENHLTDTVGKSQLQPEQVSGQPAKGVPDQLTSPPLEISPPSPLPSSVAEYSKPKEEAQAKLKCQFSEQLRQIGISQREACNLAQIAVYNDHPDDYVNQCLAYIARQRNVHNREGLLVHLIKTNWQPEPNGLVRTSTNQEMEEIVVVASRAQLLPEIIEMEQQNLKEARSDRERQMAQNRLERACAMHRAWLQSEKDSPQNPLLRGENHDVKVLVPALIP
jgi:hypothetical protein